jgi:hypothetical protein
VCFVIYRHLLGTIVYFMTFERPPLHRCFDILFAESFPTHANWPCSLAVLNRRRPLAGGTPELAVATADGGAVSDPGAARTGSEGTSKTIKIRAGSHMVSFPTCHIQIALVS